jgi:hypothetical protein
VISQLEFSARVALCRQLANQEPANRALWMAEAEKWLRLGLSKERLRGEAGKNRFRHLGKFAGAVGKMLISFGVGKSRMKKYDRCRRVLRAKYPLFDLDAAMPRIASRLVLV